MTSFSIALGVLVVIAISVYIIAGIVSGGTTTYDASELRLTAAAQRIEPVSRVVETGSPEALAEAEAQQQAQSAPQVASAAPAMSGAEVYNSGCNACHATGVLEAPKLGDQEVWTSRYDEKGLDQLVHNAVTGINQMPAKGGNPALSETNIHDAVVYMLTESGIEVPEADKAEVTAESPAAEQPAETAAAEPAPAAETAVTDSSPTETATAATAPAAETAATETAPTETAPAAAATEQTSGTPAGEQQAAAATETPPASATSEAQPAATAESAGTQAPAQTAALVPDNIDIAAGKQVYDMACFVCHAGAVPNAPKLGDKEAWAPRLAQGWDVLVQHSLTGYNAMPAKGGRADLSDEQVTAAVGYMAAQAQ